MRKSAQEKIQDFLEESRETRDAINELVNNTKQHFGDYGYAAGYLQSFLGDVIAELPRARRAEIRDRLYAKALEYRSKEAA
jgi:hypothetical protein